MNKLLLIASLFMATLTLMAPAQARTHVGIYANFGYGGYPYYYSSYYYPYYVEPPPVVYAVPPAPPVVYAEPATVYAPEAPVVSANQTSPTFIDSAGRTCRHYEATSPGGA